MSSITATCPTISATRDGRFPLRSDFDAVWAEIVEVSNAWRDVNCAEFIRGWCGHAPNRIADKVLGVNHIAIYMGDYERDEEVLDWNSYLNDLQAASQIKTVEMGSSYISPRQYGTEGWWNAVVLSDGRAVETFTCKASGPWADRSADERRRLMSHVAIDVRSEYDVRQVLETLGRAVKSVEIIAFTKADGLGHTYGHVRNNANMTVLEIVYQAPLRRE